MKKKNHIILRLMENGKCIHAHKIKGYHNMINQYGDLFKYTKETYPNRAGGYTTIVEVNIQTLNKL